MKKMNVSISMWDSLAIPGQVDMLQSELPKRGSVGENIPSVVFANNEKSNSKPAVPTVKPPPFYVSLIIGNNLVHNCMIDSGATSSVMPKKVADQLGVKYQPLKKGVVQLDGSAVNTIGVIKDASLTLHACPTFSIP